MVVVLPDPLTPTTTITAGSPAHGQGAVPPGEHAGHLAVQGGAGGGGVGRGRSPHPFHDAHRGRHPHVGGEERLLEPGPEGFVEAPAEEAGEPLPQRPAGPGQASLQAARGHRSHGMVGTSRRTSVARGRRRRHRHTSKAASATAATAATTMTTSTPPPR